MKKLDDMRRVGAVVCLGSGAWSLVTGIESGAWWKVAAGFALIVFSFVLAYYLHRESLL